MKQKNVFILFLVFIMSTLYSLLVGGFGETIGENFAVIAGLNAEKKFTNTLFQWLAENFNTLLKFLLWLFLVFLVIKYIKKQNHIERYYKNFDVICSPNDKPEDILALLTQKNLCFTTVIENNQVVGIVFRQDLE